ncbi:MAG: hypothetical protein LUG64_00350 [Clostridiales bacterium]|nr:hypothetical protein [Clostridiales bacterium]
MLLALQAGEASTEELAARVDIPVDRMMSALTLLHLRGLVEELPGSRFKTELRVK